MMISVERSHHSQVLEDSCELERQLLGYIIAGKPFYQYSHRNDSISAKRKLSVRIDYRISDGD